MNESHLTLTSEERTLIERLLEQELDETRTEFHHTSGSSPAFRERVRAEEKLVRGLLDKMRQTVA